MRFCGEYSLFFKTFCYNPIMETLELVERARTMALDAHKDQKYGDEPYSVHLEAVAKLARPYGEWAEALAWLHDIVEDTHVTLDDIQESFALVGRICVGLLTDEPGENRKARKAATYAKLAQVEDTTFEKLALIVKACDRLANLRACKSDPHGLLKMYRKEHDLFRKSCYRCGLCDDIWEEIDLIIGHQ